MTNNEIKERVEEICKGKEFNDQQIRKIRYGLEKGLDVSQYADPKYNEYQMGEIKYGLENNIDVSSYLDPSISTIDMLRIRFNLEY